MTKTKTLVIGAFVLAFVAGVPFGWALEQRNDQPKDGSWLKRRLDLNAEQERQINEIWSGVVERSHAGGRERMRALYGERDAEIRALLSEDQQERYKQIVEKYQSRRSEHFQEMKALNNEAVENTKAVLDDEQRVKYEALIERRRDRDRHLHL